MDYIVRYLNYAGDVRWTTVEDAVDEDDAISKAYDADSMFSSSDNILKIIDVSVS